MADESLFASKKNGRKGPASSAAVASRSNVARLAGKSIVGGPGTVVLSRSELDSIRNMAVIKTREEIMADRDQREKERYSKQVEAQARKHRMRELEKERMAKEKHTFMDQVRQQESNALLRAAHEKMDESEDLVKHMNQKCLYALTVGVRDAQVEEKKQRKAKVVEEERRQDILMEIDRLEDLQRRAAEEKKQKIREKEDALVIVQQVAAREKQRMLDLEARDLEGRQMVAAIKKRDAAELEKIRLKRLEGEKLLQEVLDANRKADAGKLAAIARDREEDARIAAYVKARDAKEAAQEAEKEAQRARMEAETARLRALQEKAADSQAEEDQRRARRYQDQMERKERDEMAATERKRKAQLVELKSAREEQQRIKERAKAEEAILQKAAYRKVLAEQKEEHLKELAVEEKKAEARRLHQIELKKQIVEAREAKVIARESRFEEGKKIALDQARHKAKLERIRQKKIESLQKAKVPEKYLAELRSMKIEDH